MVLENLRNAFPEKSEQDLQKIAKKYYRHMCNLLAETFKILVFSKRTAIEHCSMHPDAKKLFEQYHRSGKSIIIVMGHFGNWEWAGSTFSIECPQQLFVVYRPLSNQYFEKIALNMRTRFGARALPMRDTLKGMLSSKNVVSATAFVADQTPPPEGAYWTTFLNQPTPVFVGTEKIARKLNYPVVYVSVRPVKRGYYQLWAETLVEEPSTTQDGEISERHTKRLEKDIREMPEYWLWSHRRWKHKAPKDFQIKK